MIDLLPHKAAGQIFDRTETKTIHWRQTLVEPRQRRLHASAHYRPCTYQSTDTRGMGIEIGQFFHMEMSSNSLLQRKDTPYHQPIGIIADAMSRTPGSSPLSPGSILIRINIDAMKCASFVGLGADSGHRRFQCMLHDMSLNMFGDSRFAGPIGCWSGVYWSEYVWPALLYSDMYMLIFITSPLSASNPGQVRTRRTY